MAILKKPENLLSAPVLVGLGAGAASRRRQRQLVTALLCSMLLVPLSLADGAFAVHLEYVFGEGLRLPERRTISFAYDGQEGLASDTESAAQRKHFDTKWLSNFANGILFVAAIGGMVYLARRNSDCSDSALAACAVVALAAPCRC